MIGHLSDEEDVLLLRCGGVDREGEARIKAEHRELEQLVAQLERTLDAAADPRELMEQIGELIHDHVRYEERRFFERVQERLSAAELAELGRAIADHRAARISPSES